jgi:hypothetical protein
MKKTYMEPTLEVVKIETTQMLAASVEGFNSALDVNPCDAGDALAPGLPELDILTLPEGDDFLDFE